MLSISRGALDALPGAIGRPVRAEWSNDGGLSWHPCRVEAGSARITADRTAETRYTASATLLDVAAGRDGINSISTTVRLWQGVQAPRTDPEWLPAGVYTVASARRSRTGGIGVELAGLEAELRAATLPTVRTYGPASARTVVEQVAAEALPGVPVAWLPGVAPDTPVPQLLADESRWSVLSQADDGGTTAAGVAQALAGEVWVDARGVLTVGPVPTLDDPVVWRIGRGTGGVLVEPQEEQTDDGLVNVWSVSGDGGDGGAVVGPAFAWDDDPNSLTYAGPDPVDDPLAPQREGLWWVRLRAARYSSALITTLPQATAVAKARLADSLGVRASLSLTAVCNPSLEPGDVVDVEVTPGAWERHLIDSLSYTLGGASMSCSTRTSVRRL